MKRFPTTVSDEMIRAALGQEKCDLVLKNATVLNVFTEELIVGDIGICGEIIVGVGSYNGKQEVDLSGKYAVPGFIDGHMHIESSMVAPALLAGEILPWGTTTIIADPHEVANVSGINGIRYILEQSKDLPLNVYVMLPSCVPSSPFEESGAKLLAEDLLSLKNEKNVLGLGEMMDYPGVIGLNQEVHEKLRAFADRVIDGHAPNLAGKELEAYRLSGVATDHECSTEKEVLEKLRSGMFILAREGSAAKNLEAIVTTALKNNIPLDRIAFCTDDKHIQEIRESGHIRYNIKKAIDCGLPPIKAYKMASYNSASFYGLNHLGAIGAGYQGDIVVLDSFEDVAVNSVYQKGKLVSKGTKNIPPVKTPSCPKELLGSVKLKPVSPCDLELVVRQQASPIMELMPNQITTKLVYETLAPVGEAFVCSGDRRKIVVAQRHKEDGKLGIGVVKGYTIRGAVASSVAHDNHNIVAIGDNDEDIACAINRLIQCQGGYTLVKDGEVLGTVELPVCGLMTHRSADELGAELSKLIDLARDLGVAECYDPFITLSFLSLTVIPELRISHQGVFSTAEQKFLEI